MKNICESSIPKSVIKPVRCVVLTTDCETLVTKEFWIPIAKRSMNAITCGARLRFTSLKPEKPMKEISTISINRGIRCDRIFLRFDKNSIIKLDVKDPKRKHRMKSRYTKAVRCLFNSISSEKKSKMPSNISRKNMY